MIDKNEMLLVVDENNQPTTPQPRHLAHSKKLWHRTSHVWIRNKQGQILCQQRSMLKDIYPGYWEGRFGGHLPPETEYSDGAIAELKEEIDLDVDKKDLRFWKVHKYQNKADSNYEFQSIYLLDWDGEIKNLKLEVDEVAQITWVDLGELKKKLLLEKDNKWRALGYEQDFFNWLDKQPPIPKSK